MARHQLSRKRLHLGWLVPLLVIVLVGGGTTVAKLSGQQPLGAARPRRPRPDRVRRRADRGRRLVVRAGADRGGPDAGRRARTAPGWTWCRPTGAAAAAEVAGRDADVWIPDDAAWAGTQGMAQLAPAATAGSGTVLATSPFYLVTDPGTAAQGDRRGGRLARAWTACSPARPGHRRSRWRCAIRPDRATACWPRARSGRRSGSPTAWTPRRWRWPGPCR